MVHGPAYKVDYRRKRAGLTNYKKRLKLLTSEKPRLVVRKSNNATQCQIVQYSADGDRTIVSASSLDLKKYGFKGHAGSLPAAYLTGMMCGLKAKKQKVTEAILDTGLYRSTPGSRIYAAVKGAIDSGLKVPIDESMLPQERRLQGYHIADYAKLIKAKAPEQYEKQFSKMLTAKFEPEQMVEHFQEAKKRIVGEFAR
jgi:large subunit ribosomal protein L18